MRIAGPVHDLNLLGAKPNDDPGLVHGDRHGENAGGQRTLVVRQVVVLGQPIGREGSIARPFDQPAAQCPHGRLVGMPAAHDQILSAQHDDAIGRQHLHELVEMVRDRVIERALP